MLLINPKSKTLEEDIRIYFKDVMYENVGFSQCRRGRFVVNLKDYFPIECLVLDEDDNVIDGYCGFPSPAYTWKDKLFAEHLRDLFKLDLDLEDYEALIERCQWEEDERYWIDEEIKG